VEGRHQITGEGTSSELLAAFMIECQCGERLLLGDALGATPDEQTGAWRATLADVARRLDVPLVWGEKHAHCPLCGTPVLRVSAARR
jgi:hypothetical protein